MYIDSLFHYQKNTKSSECPKLTMITHSIKQTTIRNNCVQGILNCCFYNPKFLDQKCISQSGHCPEHYKSYMVNCIA